MANDPPFLQACGRSGRHVRACGLNRHRQTPRQGFSERPALHIQRSDNRWLAARLFLKPDGVLRLPLRDKYKRLSLNRCLLGLPLYPLAYPPPEEYMKVMFTRHGRRAGVRVNTPSLHIVAIWTRAVAFAVS